MKKLIFIILAFLFSLGACTASPAPLIITTPPSTVSPSADQSVLPSGLPSVSPSEVSVSQTPSPNIIPSLTNETSQPVVPDTDIPDTETDIGEYAADRIGVYESEEYVFYLNNYYLYCISKSNKNITKVSENNSSSWVLYNDIVYYAEDIGIGTSSDDSEIIKRYDPQTGTTEDIYNIKNFVYDIAVYKDIIYFRYVTDMRNENLPTDLWAVNLDGSGAKCVRKDIDSFCIYKDTIYYMSYDMWKPTTLYKCALDGSGKQKVLDKVYPQFQINNGKLYCVNADTILDLDTGTKTPVSMSGDDGFTFWGKYILYIERNYQGAPELYAFDFTAGKTYYIMDFGEYNAYLITALSKNAYIDLIDNGGTYLSKITIKKGKASLSKVAYFPDDTNDNDGDDEDD
jgi:hypothetical protein